MDYDFFSEWKVEWVLAAAREDEKNGRRNTTILLIMYRCQLSIDALLSLKWSQIDLELGFLYTKTLSKNDVDFIYPLFQSELKFLRMLKQKSCSQYVFVSSKDHKRLSRMEIKRIIAKVRKKLLHKKESGTKVNIFS